MHTSAFKTCRIHHNSDYSCDVYITNEDSTSKSIGNKSTIIFSSKKLIELANKKMKGNITLQSISKDPTDREFGKQITIAYSDIVSFAYCKLEDKITSKIQTGLGIPYKKLKKIAKFLNINVQN